MWGTKTGLDGLQVGKGDGEPHAAARLGTIGRLTGWAGPQDGAATPPLANRLAQSDFFWRSTEAAARSEEGASRALVASKLPFEPRSPETTSRPLTLTAWLPNSTKSANPGAVWARATRPHAPATIGSTSQAFFARLMSVPYRGAGPHAGP